MAVVEIYREWIKEDVDKAVDLLSKGHYVYVSTKSRNEPFIPDKSILLIEPFDGELDSLKIGDFVFCSNGAGINMNMIKAKRFGVNKRAVQISNARGGNKRNITKGLIYGKFKKILGVTDDWTRKVKAAIYPLHEKKC